MNLIEGQVQRDGGGAPVFAFDRWQVPLDGLADVPGGPATLGVRPEAIRVEGVADGIQARVSLVEPLGKETLLYLDYQGIRLLIAVAGPSFHTEEGAPVSFDLRGGRLYLFDTEGNRLRRGR
jgi:ABC-type sugar transport system ATPase subunit